MVSKTEVHTSSVMLLVVQISMFVFNCRKLCETCVLFVNIYNLTLSKPYEHLYDTHKVVAKFEIHTTLKM
jgi:hypothetical protein